MKREEEILRRNVENAIEILAPAFDIDERTLQSFRSLSFNVDTSRRKASYDPLEAKFIFPPGYVNLVEAVGEETSHYLHGELNRRLSLYELTLLLRLQERKIGKLKFARRFYKVRNLMELVGHYGALVYADAVDESIESADNMFDSVWENEGFLSYLSGMISHWVGYRRAEILFSRFGGSLLPAVSRMSIREADKELPRLAPLTLYQRRILPLVDKARGYR